MVAVPCMLGNCQYQDHFMGPPVGHSRLHELLLGLVGNAPDLHCGSAGSPGCPSVLWWVAEYGR
eukprot:4503697-Pyramimonas_sp.AAC.1